MWAASRELQAAGQQAAAVLRPPRRKKQESNRILLCQVILCLAAALAAFCLQKAAPQQAEKLKAEARTLLNSPLQGQEEIVRFAVAAADEIEKTVQEVKNAQAASAQPQVWAAFGLGKKAPEGCSLQSLVPPMPLNSPLPALTQTSGYGWRKVPQKDFHTGIDLAAGQGTPVYPALSGYVRAAGYQQSYGNYLRILHENGVETLYAHLQYLFVGQGDLVLPTTCLGTVGQTGSATGPHLHFELLQNDIRYDPAEALGL